MNNHLQNFVRFNIEKASTKEIVKLMLVKAVCPNTKGATYDKNFMNPHLVLCEASVTLNTLIQQGHMPIWLDLKRDYQAVMKIKLKCSFIRSKSFSDAK